MTATTTSTTGATRPITRADRIPIIALLTASAISRIGNMLTLLAVPWFVLETTGSAGKTGITAFAALLPMLIAGIFGGVIVDHWGYKRASVFADLASCGTVALIPLLYHTVGLPFAALVALMFLGALLDAPGGAARFSLIPELAEKAGMRLDRVNAASDATHRISQLLGPPIAGVLIAVVGASNVLWLDAATFAISAGLVAVFVTSKRAARSESPQTASRGRYFADIADGFRFVWNDRLIRAIVILFMLSGPFDRAMYLVVMPVFVKRVYGDALDLGLIVAAGGAGALAGTILYGALAGRVSRRTLYIVGSAIITTELWVMLTKPPLAVLVATAVVVGLAAGPLNPIFSTILHERVPDGMRARVIGVLETVGFTTIPLGTLLSGFAVEWFSLTTTIAVMAVAYLAVGLVLIFIPALREMD